MKVNCIATDTLALAVTPIGDRLYKIACDTKVSVQTDEGVFSSSSCAALPRTSAPEVWRWTRLSTRSATSARASATWSTTQSTRRAMHLAVNTRFPARRATRYCVQAFCGLAWGRSSPRLSTTAFGSSGTTPTGKTTRSRARTRNCSLSNGSRNELSGAKKDVFR